MRSAESPRARIASRENARAFVRVRPHANKPVVLTVRTEHDASTAFQVAVADMSAGGVAFAAAAHQAPRIERGSRIVLEVSLHGAPPVLVLHGVVRHRSSASGFVRFGVKFENEADDGFDASQERIMRYVMERQQELLASRLRY
jgi:c-di-GMP-binding flagellar brake protein YcgR